MRSRLARTSTDPPAQFGQSSTGPADLDEAVSVRSLTKRYGGISAVEDLTFRLQAGTVTGFLGPNGAGKTTTLRLLLGLAEPTSGAALVFGRRYRDLDQPARRSVRCWNRTTSIPDAPAVTTCVRSPSPQGSQPVASPRFWNWSS